MNIVLFSPEEIHTPLPLSDERTRHIISVLHKKQGDMFDAGIINGQAGTACIESIDCDGIVFSFEAKSDGKPLHPLTMIIGFPRPIQLKRLLRDIASLGASEVHLTGTELGEKSYMKSTLVERGTAQSMLKDGSVQAKSTHIPRLFLHNSLKECIIQVTAQREPDVIPAEAERFFCSTATVESECHNIKEKPVFIALDNVRPECSLMHHSLMNSITAAQLRQRGVIAAIGSERGWTDAERSMLIQAGFTLCSMGDRVLRTETAATAAATLILSKMEIL